MGDRGGEERWVASHRGAAAPAAGWLRGARGAALLAGGAALERMALGEGGRLTRGSPAASGAGPVRLALPSAPEGVAASPCGAWLAMFAAGSRVVGPRHSLSARPSRKWTDVDKSGHSCLLPPPNRPPAAASPARAAQVRVVDARGSGAGGHGSKGAGAGAADAGSHRTLLLPHPRALVSTPPPPLPPVLTGHVSSLLPY